MSNRHAVRARKIPVSITLPPDDYEFIEMLVNSGRFYNRTHVIVQAIAVFKQEYLKQQAQMQQAQQIQQNTQQPPQQQRQQ
jgi:Arc/MetJ-type ribon-helix-helix transcriptional regulator